MSSGVDLDALTQRLNRRFGGISGLRVLEDGTLQVDLEGAECPGHSLTLEQEILELVEEEFPSIRRVQAGPAVSRETMDLVYQILRGKP